MAENAGALPVHHLRAPKPLIPIVPWHVLVMQKAFVAMHTG